MAFGGPGGPGFGGHGESGGHGFGGHGPPGRHSFGGQGGPPGGFRSCGGFGFGYYTGYDGAIYEHDDSQEPAPTRSPSVVVANILATLTLFSGGFLLLANFLAAKIWALGPIILDGGILVYPAIYIVGDLAVELYGERAADRILWKSALLNVIALVACLLARLLPGLDGANSVDLATAFGISARIMGASVIAFLISGIVNNSFFTRIRETSENDNFITRALGSSAIARLFDIAIFNTLAFAGRTTAGEFFLQMIFSYLAGMALEAALSPLSKRIAKHLEDKVYCAGLSPSERERYKLNRRSRPRP